MERRSPPDSFFSRRCIGTLPTLRKPGATTAARKNLRETLRRAPFAKALRASRMTAAAFWMAALLGFFDHGFWADYYYYAVFCNGVAGGGGFGVRGGYCTFGEAFGAGAFG